MKKYLLAGAFALSSIAGANAQVTNIFITGATAFRTPLSAALNNSTSANRFFTGSPGPLTKAVDASSSNGAIAKFGTWTGNVTGITGEVRVHVSLSGSLEGIRDLTTGNTTTPFFPSSIATAAGNVSVANSSATLLSASNFAFSDAFQSSSPYPAPVLEDIQAGIIPFVMVTNDGAPARWTNVLASQFNTVFKTGFLKLSVFTGNFTDDTVQVFATGRYDLSGTRIIYLSDTGVGIGTPVSQYKPIGTTTALTALQLWPTNDAPNASTNDQPGNGGWEGSATVRDFMGATSNAVEIQYDDGTRNDDFPNATYSALMLSAVGPSDAATVVTTGGRILTYNGAAYASGVNGAVQESDRQGVYNGSYTLWGYEHLFNLPGAATGNLLTARNRFVAAFGDAGILGSSGLRTSLMKVSRAIDGVPPSPINQF